MRKEPQDLSWIACSVSGVLMVLAFAPLAWSWCGWVALTPAWFALRNFRSVQKRPLRYGYLLGLIFIAGSFWWVMVASLMGFLIMLAGLSFYPALWFLLVTRLLPLSPSGERAPIVKVIGTVLIAASFWVTLEWLRDWFLTGFNWNELGVSQTPNACIRQLAALGGVPLLSFVVATFSLVLAESIQASRKAGPNRVRRASVLVSCCIVIVAGSWLYGSHHLQRHQGEPARQTLRYACIQPNIPEIPYESDMFWEFPPLEEQAYQIQERLSAQAIRTQPPDLLIWPEAITSQRFGTDPMIGAVVKDVSLHFHGDFLMGAEEFEAGKLYTCAFLIRPNSAPVQDYHKIHLVVLSEYSPLQEEISRKPQYGFVAGDRPASFTLSQKPVTLSPFICFEETQPDIVNAASQLHPDFFVVLTNDDWFAGISAVWGLQQQLQNGLLRTVEHDRSMIRCANNGVSCEIDPDGNILARIQDKNGKFANVPGLLSRVLSLKPPQITLYERWGNWVALACQITTLLVGITVIGRRSSFH